MPSLAESWDVSEDGKTVTYHLRQDGKWTNGDPVTASDFVYSWKRTLSPELAADYAYDFPAVAPFFSGNPTDRDPRADADALALR